MDTQWANGTYLHKSSWLEGRSEGVKMTSLLEASNWALKRK